MVKLVSAEINNELGILDESISSLIIKAAQEVIDGKLDDGAHRISAIYLLQNLLDPDNPLWKNIKLKIISINLIFQLIVMNYL